MPQPRKSSERRPANGKPTPSNDRVAEAIVFAALAAQVLLLVALVLHRPDGGTARGIVGSVGRFAAYVVYGLFGVLSYLLVSLGIWTTSLRLARKSLTSPRWRAAGFVLFLVGGCTLVHQFFPRSELVAAPGQFFGYDPGGALGAGAHSLVAPAFGNVGTFLFSTVLLCTGIAFATDWLLYEMAYGLLRRAGSLFGLLKRFWPEPVLAAGPVDAPAALVESSKRAKDAAAEAASMRSATAAPPAASPAPLLTFPPGAASGATSIDDPVIEIPADLADRLAPAEVKTEKKSRTPKEPSPKESSEKEAASKESSAKETADAPDTKSDDPKDALDADDAAVDPADAPAPPRPVLQVKLEPPVAAPAPAESAATGNVAQGPKRFRIGGVKLERPRKEGEYEFPSHQLLERPKPRNLKQLEQAIQSNADVLQRTLAEFKIDGQVVAFQQGPVVTMLEVALAPGTKVTKIHALADDLAMALKAEAVRIVAPIPGKSTVGVEIPNPVRDDVRMLQLLESPEFLASTAHIPMLLGCAADGRPLVEDLASMPHLLIAGSTGSGKSVCINTILLSILTTRTPDDVRLILIDPKQVELAFFAEIPHLLSPVVTDMKRASAVLEWALDKMEERYDTLRRFEVRNIAAYNELGEKAILARAKELEMDDEVVHAKLPYIVIVVDELADLMLSVGKDVETAITRLAQKSRAVGIHVILATQRPSTDVITGLIKANMPTRIAFKVASKIDSRVILDQNGADKLLGMGDMLYMPPRSSTIARAQCTYASDREVKRIVGFLRERYTQAFSDELVQLSTQPLLDSSEKDELYDQAVRIVLGEQRGSASLLQRALSVGYTRASRLLDLMRAEGVVGAYKGSKASEVLMSLEDYEARVAAAGGSSPSDDDAGDDGN